jgi:hypothetical protein
MPTTRDFHDSLAIAARRIVAEFGIERLDSMSLDTAKRYRQAMVAQLIDETGCQREAARRHIATAARQLRHPDFAEEKKRWGRPPVSA